MCKGKTGAVGKGKTAAPQLTMNRDMLAIIFLVVIFTFAVTALLTLMLFVVWVYQV